MDQLLAHLAGDYILQSRWMAEEKTKSWTPAIVHGLVYTLPFALITTNLVALSVIASTHVLIDHFRLAKRAMWLRDRLAPSSHWTTWDVYKEAGHPTHKFFWLMVVIDNSIHLIINYAALSRWG